MAANDLSLSNVVNVSVSAAQAGAGAYSTSNLALFSRDTPGGGFGALGYKIYVEPGEVATDFGTSSDTYKIANSVFSQQPNILAGNGYLVIIPFLALETLAAAIARTEDLVQYFGLMADEISSEADMDAAAAVVQALNKIAFFVSKTSADVAPGGMLDDLATSGFTKSRGLYYGASTAIGASVMAGAYASRALSVNFEGSNTTSTMHLKDLAGIEPDPSMNQTLLGQCQDAGVDVYVSLRGVPKVYCSGINDFFDQVYNLGWLVGAIQLAGFNFLAQAATKIPQTENGMTALKGSYRAVLEQAVTNQYAAPGSWTSATTFGNQGDFLANIAQRGYYIYSSPIATQLQAAREARQAPLVQIALKEAGAIHESSVIININA